MRNLVFVIWMLGFPLVTALVDRFRSPLTVKLSTEEEVISALIELFIWGYVGYILYEPRSKQT